MMTDLILHHYDFSSFSEKIRLVLGLKGLHWRSVVIPSVMPKPDLIALTGGYRHTPVLQVGADVFCDTRLIARELDRRCPQPPLLDPHLTGLALAVEAWAERDLFWPVARYVSGTNAENLAPELHADRAALRGKRTPTMARLKAVAEASFGLVQAQIPRVENMLGDGRSYLLSGSPGVADFAVYHALWFLSAMPIDCSAVIAAFPRTRSWMQRMRSFGHGTCEDMSPREALQAAMQASPAPVTASSGAAFDPPLGTRIALRPEEYPAGETIGGLVFADRDEIAIHRTDPSLGDVVVHFPRVGYALRQI